MPKLLTQEERVALQKVMTQAGSAPTTLPEEWSALAYACRESMGADNKSIYRGANPGFYRVNSLPKPGTGPGNWSGMNAPPQISWPSHNSFPAAASTGRAAWLR